MNDTFGVSIFFGKLIYFPSKKLSKRKKEEPPARLTDRPIMFLMDPLTRNRGREATRRTLLHHSTVTDGLRSLLRRLRSVVSTHERERASDEQESGDKVSRTRKAAASVIKFILLSAWNFDVAIGFFGASNKILWHCRCIVGYCVDD
ncbi:hypothetical protein R1flu_021029 [Riccia fluitans]|uniref:Uncharacterized protein n=1 Tax=Riccia fluitans TaxID=41844 RepID=A0ABD1ZPT1_9MARC